MKDYFSNAKYVIFVILTACSVLCVNELQCLAPAGFGEVTSNNKIGVKKITPNTGARTGISRDFPAFLRENLDLPAFVREIKIFAGSKEVWERWSLAKLDKFIEEVTNKYKCYPKITRRELDLMLIEARKYVSDKAGIRDLKLSAIATNDNQRIVFKDYLADRGVNYELGVTKTFRGISSVYIYEGVKEYNLIARLLNPLQIHLNKIKKYELRRAQRIIARAQ